MPNATSIAVGLSVVGASVNTLSDVYRVWQAGTPAGNFPEVSADGGNTFAPVALSGISQNEPAGFQPGFAIDPVPTVVNGVPHSLLLYGADRVYLTDSSTNVWDPISPVLSSGAYVSAVAFAPSATGVYYAGTTNGEIFFDSPTVNWQNRSVGLPGNPALGTAPQINNIVVDPNNNLIAFAMLGGGPNTSYVHVYKTSNGGLTWTPDAAAAGGGNIPDDSAYSMVIDPTVQAGAPWGGITLARLSACTSPTTRARPGQNWVRVCRAPSGQSAVRRQPTNAHCRRSRPRRL